VNLASHPLPNRDFLRAIREAWGTHGSATASWMIEIGTFLGALNRSSS
jgi:hypothetical protein